MGGVVGGVVGGVLGGIGAGGFVVGAGNGCGVGCPLVCMPELSSEFRISATALVRSVQPWMNSASFLILWPDTSSLVFTMLTTSGVAEASFVAPLPGV